MTMFYKYRFFPSHALILSFCLLLLLPLSAYGREAETKDVQFNYLFQNDLGFDRIEAPSTYRIDSSLQVALNETASDPYPGNENNDLHKPKKERWSSFLPFKAEEAISRGYELPLPFGISANMVYMNREVAVKDINAAINGPPVDLNNYAAIDTDNRVFSSALRLDTWIFPFLNIYTLGGYVENKTKVAATLIIPPLIPEGTPKEVPLNFDADLDGSVFGAGLTLVAGHQDFFLLVDANYNKTDLGGLFDQEIEIFLYSFRSGWRGQISGYMTTLYLGGMSWDSEREIEGSIQLDTENVLNFRVIQGPSEPQNFLTGVNVEFSKMFQMVLEYGYNFHDLQMFTTSIAYRF